MAYRVAVLGAGSFFADSVAEGLCESELFADCVYVLMDVDAKRLEKSEARIREIVRKAGAGITIEATTSRSVALEGCDYVVTSCEQNRVPFWVRDIEIPERFGVHQLLGENGGPGGQIHAMRNVTMFMGIRDDMRRLCPDAWLMNFTNPMSFVCTYLHKHSGVQAMALDPYVRSITQARKIVDAYLKEYAEVLPQFG